MSTGYDRAVNKRQSGTTRALPEREKHNTTLALRIILILERRNTMTIEQVVLMNGAQYLWSLGLLGLLALAWVRLQREK
jgi:hypothetical protein